MRNLIKQKHIGITLTIVGIALLSLNFLSYLMSDLFVSRRVLPVGILLLIIGIIVVRQSRKKSRNHQQI